MTKSRRRRITTAVRYAVLTGWAVIAFFPIYWMVATSFKPDTQWFSWPPVYFPDPPTLANYLNVWLGAEEYAATQYAISSQKPLISLGNSLVIATTSTFLAVLFGSVIALPDSRSQIADANPAMVNSVKFSTSIARWLMTSASDCPWNRL